MVFRSTGNPGRIPRIPAARHCDAPLLGCPSTFEPGALTGRGTARVVPLHTRGVYGAAFNKALAKAPVAGQYCPKASPSKPEPWGNTKRVPSNLQFTPPRKSSVFLRLVALRNGFQPCRHCWKGLGRVFQCRVQLMWSNNLCTSCRFTLLLRGPRNCNLVTILHPTIRQKRHLGHCYSPDLSRET